MRRDRRSGWGVQLLLFTFLFLLYAGSSRGQLISTDEILSYEATRSLWQSGRPSMVITEGSHTSPGREGLTYSAVNSGQAILCLPLFAAGRAVEVLLSRAQAWDWLSALGGPPLARSGLIWGGEVELGFTALFNCAVGAATACLFFLFSLRLGASPPWALLATAGLALGSLPVGYYGTLFTQPIEALGVLASLYWLYRDRLTPSPRLRAAAGAAFALALQCRYPTLLALPALSVYHLWVVLGRSRRLAAVVELLPFGATVSLGFLLHAADQYWKFGSFANQAAYSDPHFTSPLGVALAGYLLSPGYSVFLYTPLLLLCPVALVRLRRSHPEEAVAIVLLAGVYLLVMGRFEFWHGLWCFGPRYTLAYTPALLLPLGPWLTGASRAGRGAALLLGLLGMLVAAAHLTVNFWWVTLHEGWLGQTPMYAFLFSPEQSMVAAQLKAMLAWDHRVDFWLLRIARHGGWSKAGPLLALWLLSLLLSGAALRGRWRRSPAEELLYLPLPWRKIAALFALTVLLSATIWWREERWRGADANAALMTLGLSSPPPTAVAYYEIVLQRRPGHYGATYQRAKALESFADPASRRQAWSEVRRLADSIGDRAVSEEARGRLEAVR